MKIRTAATRWIILAASATLVASVPPSGAETSYAGSDYSKDSSSRRKLVTCDRESDGHIVHSDIYDLPNVAFVQRFLVDNNGANNGCHETNVSPWDFVALHRTVEEIPLWPDEVGAWVWATD